MFLLPDLASYRRHYPESGISTVTGSPRRALRSASQVKRSRTAAVAKFLGLYDRVKVHELLVQATRSPCSCSTTTQALDP